MAHEKREHSEGVPARVDISSRGGLAISPVCHPFWVGRKQATVAGGLADSTPGYCLQPVPGFWRVKDVLAVVDSERAESMKSYVIAKRSKEFPALNNCATANQK